MSDWADIALQHRPGDEEATKKKADAVRLLSEKKVRDEQYKSIIQRASKSLDDKRWQDALSQSEAALNLMPESKEAKRIHEEARKQIDTKVQIEKYLDRADLFLAQKSYAEAIEELRKVQSFDTDNEEVKKRINKIESEKSKHEDEIASLIDKYNKAYRNREYDKAITICNSLINKDTANQGKWAERIESLKSEKSNAAKIKEEWDNLNREINTALFDERWKDVVSLGKRALEIHNDESLKSNIKRAEQKLSAKKAEETYLKTIDQVKARMSDKDWDEARRILGELKKEYPEHNNEIKSLFKRIFSEESASEKRLSQHIEEVNKEKERPVRITGFTGSNDNSFFDDPPSKSSRQKPSTKSTGQKHTQKHITKKTGDDFFDMDSSSVNNKLNSKKSDISIEDFNF